MYEYYYFNYVEYIFCLVTCILFIPRITTKISYITFFTIPLAITTHLYILKIIVKNTFPTHFFLFEYSGVLRFQNRVSRKINLCSFFSYYELINIVTPSLIRKVFYFILLKHALLFNL